MSALRGCVQVGTLAVPLVVDGATPATIKRDDSTWLLTEEGGARVLHVTGGVLSLWGGFAEPADAAAFNASVNDGILSSWCCLKTHPDGLPHPEVEVWKVPYTFEGEPVPVDGSGLDTGKCGA